MKKDTVLFIKRGMAFCLIFLASLALIGSLFNYIVFHYSFAFEKANAFEKFASKNKHIDYLFMGDSHAQDAISPSVINNDSFNLAVSGLNYRENYYALKSVIEKKIKVNYVVLEVDDTMLDNPGVFEKEIFFVRNYISFKDLVGLKPAAILNYYFGFLGRGTFFGLAVTKGKPMDEFGFSVNNATIGEDDSLQVTTEETGDTTYAVPEYLSKIIELCRENNQKIIFIKYPLLPEDQKHPIYDKFIEGYLENETLLDYRHVFDDNRSFFQNLNHLNFEGANILSAQIGADLKKLGK